MVKIYDAFNRLATETDARGNVKSHSYEHARGLQLGTNYTSVDGTAVTSARSFSYNHLGQMTQVTDDAGTRTIGYNIYGEQETDSLSIDGDTHLITETRDAMGRSTGFVYAKNGVVQHSVTTGYGTDGRIASAGFTHGGASKNFGYEYLSGSSLLHKLTMPCNMSLTQTYESTRDLLTGMAYHRGSTLVAQRTYSYDILGRPTARNTARQGSVVNDTFTHNTRSELVEALVNGKDYEYTFDNIGNRQFAMEDNNAKVYDTNALNQYTAISENGAAPFVPQFDEDGNQTLIKTDTGIWSAVYNAENRPVTFTNSESNTVVECAYDSMGRRVYKKVSVNGSITLHQRYIYRGYLQIACIDLTRSHHPALWYITWDVTQPVATRPLAIQINGTWYTYGWDLTKNICELYSTGGTLTTAYTYSPFGKVTASGSLTQPIQWSSEVWDGELGLVYYNWRYYNAMVGKWQSWDRLEEAESLNMYEYCLNSPLLYQDVWGMDVITYTTDETLYRQYENIIKARQAKINEVILEINEMEDSNFIELQKQRKIRYDGKVPKTKAEMTDALKKERDGLHIVHIPAKNVKDFITKLKKDAKERKLQKDDQVFVVQHGNANVRLGDERIKHAALSKKIKNVVSHAELAACEKSGTQLIKRRLWIKYELKFQKSGNSFTQWLFGYEIEQLEWSKIVGEIEESSTKKQ